MNTVFYVPESHLRLDLEPDGTIRVSLSGHLLDLLGVPVWADWTPAPGETLAPSVPFASVETEKTVYDIALPFPGVFLDGNPSVRNEPALLARPASEGGWIGRVRPGPDDWRNGLLSEEAYAAFIAP